MPHDASATWSGFNYQGKVAIFYTLKLINEKLDEDSDFDFSTYELILENHEDFEIKQGGALVSIHQVKAYSDSAYSKYDNALIELSLELERHPDVTGYLHTWKTVSIMPAGTTLLSKISSSIESIITKYNDALDKGTTIIGKVVNAPANMPKKAKIIKRAFEDLGIQAPTEPQVLDYLQQIMVAGTGSINRISRYQYPSGNLCCELDELTNLITIELSTLFDNTAHLNTEKQSENAFNFVLGKLDDHIIERHMNLNQGDPIPIPFNVIIEIARTDFEDSSDEYVEQKFKELFLTLIPQFCHDPDLCENNDDCDDQDGCHWRNLTNLLSSLSTKELWDYYISFCPHKSLLGSCNAENLLEVDKTAILNTLFPIFHTLRSDKVYNRPSMNYLCYRPGGNCSDLYLPTTICQETRTQIARGILFNPLMLSKLYEIRTFICCDTAQKVENIERQCNQHRKGITLEEYSAQLPEEERERIMEIKHNLRIITKSEAEEVINAD